MTVDVGEEELDPQRIGLIARRRCHPVRHRKVRVTERRRRQLGKVHPLVGAVVGIVAVVGQEAELVDVEAKPTVLKNAVAQVAVVLIAQTARTIEVDASPIIESYDVAGTRHGAAEEVIAGTAAVVGAGFVSQRQDS